MVIAELHKTLEKRQSELISLLEDNSDKMDIEKQHQIFGAIHELRMVLDTLEYYRSQEIISMENNTNMDMCREIKTNLNLNKKEKIKKPKGASFFGKIGHKIGGLFPKPKPKEKKVDAPEPK